MVGHTAIPLTITISFRLLNTTLDPIISDHVIFLRAFSNGDYLENDTANFLRNYGYIILYYYITISV